MKYLPLLLALPFFAACGGDDVIAVEIPLSASVGSDAFECGQMYDGLGADGGSWEARDLRFYVHDVRLVRADGTEAAVELEDDGRFQDGTVALLDFENGCGEMGNTDVNTSIRGLVADGDYTGIRFRLGVPEEINHVNAATAGAPLNLTDMWWNWNGGYKFLRVEGPTDVFDAWRIHLGSTGCEGDMMGNASCSTANRPEISLDGFDPITQGFRVDVAAAMQGASLGNTMDTPPGCMSSPMDPDCTAIFSNLGLPHMGSTAPEQRLFVAPASTR